jgi:hypothetical protein
MTTQTQAEVAAPAQRRRRAGMALAVIGVAYTISWIAGLAVDAPSPTLGASGTEIVSQLTGHAASEVANFVLTEGLPAVGLGVVSVALARAIRGSGATRAGLIALITGALAATISLVQCFLGVALARTSAPGSARLLWELVDRLDGIKMVMLAVLALAAAVTTVLPRWMRYVSGALAISIAGSGLAYLFLLNRLASLAYVAGVLLLVFIPGAPLTLRRGAGR